MILTVLSLLSKASDLIGDDNNPQNLPIFRAKKTSWQIWKKFSFRAWDNVGKYCIYIKKNNIEKANKIMSKIIDDYNTLVKLDAGSGLPVEINSELMVMQSFIEKGYFYDKFIDYCKKIGLTWYNESRFELQREIYEERKYLEEFDGYVVDPNSYDKIDEKVDKLINLTPMQKQILKLQLKAEKKIELYKKYLPNHVDEVIKEIEEFEKEVIYNFEEQKPQLKVVMDNLNNANNNLNQQTTNNVDVQQLMQQNQQLQQQMEQMQQQMNQLLQQQNKTNDPGKVINNMLNREK